MFTFQEFDIITLLLHYQCPPSNRIIITITKRFKTSSLFKHIHGEPLQKVVAPMVLLKIEPNFHLFASFTKLLKHLKKLQVINFAM